MTMRSGSNGLKNDPLKVSLKKLFKITKTNRATIIFSSMMVSPKLMEGSLTLGHEINH